MGKYEPLTNFLRRQKVRELRMTFEQIEKVIGEKLPPRAQHHRAWWSNSPSNNVMTKAWLQAGFRSEQVDVAGRKLVFRRTDISPPLAPNRGEEKGSEHPLVGWMKGTISIPEGVDLTEPADPAWGEQAWGEKK